MRASSCVYVKGRLRSAVFWSTPLPSYSSIHKLPIWGEHVFHQSRPLLHTTLAPRGGSFRPGRKQLIIPSPPAPVGPLWLPIVPPLQTNIQETNKHAEHNRHIEHTQTNSKQTASNNSSAAPPRKAWTPR